MMRRWVDTVYRAKGIHDEREILVYAARRGSTSLIAASSDYTTRSISLPKPTFIMVEVYNALPSLWDADTRFTDRDTVFAAAAPLLSRYNFEWGLCLIHAHCKLEEGELMLGRGNVSQPEKQDEIVDKIYPERWLANGQPYEFTTRPTKTPPPDLVKNLGQIVGTDGVLGLYHIEKDGAAAEGDDGINGATSVKPDEKLIEVTQGRKNIVQPMSDSEISEGVEQKGTAWDLGKVDPQTRGCAAVLHCLVDYRGGHAVHTGKHPKY